MERLLVKFSTDIRLVDMIINIVFTYLLDFNKMLVY